MRYLDRHGFSPDERHEVRFVQDPELAYVMQRYREVHDLLHVLSGLTPTVLGETAVKWLEMVQTGLPMAALSAILAPARLSSADRRSLLRLYVPWATTVGRQCVPLITVAYEDRWTQQLEDVRRELGLTQAPAASEGVLV
jgi:ubiquinone biosynthesis protein COQ4